MQKYLSPIIRHPIWISVTAFLVYLGCTAVFYPLHNDMWTVVGGDLMMAVLGYAYIKKRSFFEDTIRLHKPRASGLVWRYVVTFLVVWAVGSYTGYWIIDHVHDNGMATYSNDLNAGGVIGLLIGALVAAPLAEEILMRGIIYGALRARWNGRWSILANAVVTAVLFTALHGTVVHIGFTLTFGFFLAVLYEGTRRIEYNVFAHACFNLASLVAPAAWLRDHVNTPTMVVGNLLTLTLLGLLYRATTQHTTERNAHVAPLTD